MHTVCDVRNLTLRSGMTPKEIWDSYKRDLNTLLDRADQSRPRTPEFGRYPDRQQG